MTDAKGEAMVVEVIPIVRGMAKPTLSYFTTRKMVPGEFVKVPIRKGSVMAIVEKVHDASQAKTELKRSAFALKKVGDTSPKNTPNGKTVMTPRVPEAFMQAAAKAAEYYATTTGAILSAILPKMFLDEPELIFSGELRQARRAPGDPRNEPLLLQMEREERFAQYKSIIREALAKKTSVMFVLPTEEEALRAFDYLSHGIEEYAHLFTLGRKSKELKISLKDARQSKKSILFVTTPSGISFDRPDLETVIVERENSAAYRGFNRPFLHTRVFLQFLAAEAKKRLILGDSVLSVEALWRERNGDFRELLPLKWRLPSKGNTNLVDMKSESKPRSLGDGEFEIISPELRDLMTRALEEKSLVFLFGVRKGLAPTTVCGDCGSVLACKNCAAPVVLHADGSASIYICHACGAKRSSETTCEVCGSWKLAALGIGIDRIAKEAANLFPNSSIWILDKDRAATAAQAKKIIKEFKERGGILVGTELALLHLDRVPYAGLVSADALFSIPDFSIHERIFYLVSRLRETTAKELVVQTRNIGKQILGWATQGNVLEFYKSEISERDELSYPPFSIFVKVTYSKTSRDSDEKKDFLRQTFNKWRPEFVEGKTSAAMILRLDRSRWPIEDVTRTLSLLSPDFLIKVDPESILL
jgi:primosomal protein N'